MSTIGSYPSKPFSESQKFLVLDPENGTTSLVLGSSIKQAIQIGEQAVIAVSTTDVLLTESYAVGAIIRTAGGSGPADGSGGTYVIQPSGSGGLPIFNGNEAVLLPFGDLAGSDVSDALVTYSEGEKTVKAAFDDAVEDIDNRVIRVGSVASPVLTILIPTDYATAQEAIDDLSQKYTAGNGQIIDIVFEAGHEPSSGITVNDGDYGHFKISSQDAILNTSASFTGRFIRASKAIAPTLNCYVNGGGNLDRIYSLEGACLGYINNNCGGENTSGRIFYVQASFLYAGNTIWKNGGEFAYVNSGSGLQAGGVTFEDFTSSLATVQASRGGSVEMAGSTLRNCVNGLHAKRAGSSINCHDSTFENISERVFLAERGASISALNAVCTEVGGELADVSDGFLEFTSGSATAAVGNSSSAIVGRLGRISAGEASIDGFGVHGIYAWYATQVKANRATVTNCGGDGVRAAHVSSIDFDGGTSTGNVGRDLHISNGSSINANGATTTNGAGSPALVDTNLNGGFNIDDSNGNRGFIWT